MSMGMGYRYKNGNYVVINNSYRGTGMLLKKRALRIGEELISDFPDSIDLKISNRCSIGCKYCHENSIASGKIFDIQKTTEILSQLPKVPIEIAIGGGDVFENPEETLELVAWLRKNDFCPRITINYKDLQKDWGDKIEPIYTLLRNIDAIGISLENLDGIKFMDNEFTNDILDNTKITLPFDSTKVYHIIVGIFPPEQILDLYKKGGEHILFLGYKQWGRAKNDILPTNKIEKTREIIKSILESNNYNYNLTLGFDNLALEQLRLREIIPENLYDKLYMGDEGTHSMYIDAVNGEYARTSRDPERISWDNIGLLEFFKQL